IRAGRRRRSICWWPAPTGTPNYLAGDRDLATFKAFVLPDLSAAAGSDGVDGDESVVGGVGLCAGQPRPAHQMVVAFAAALPSPRPALKVPRRGAAPAGPSRSGAPGVRT